MYKWLDQLDLGAKGLWFPTAVSILLVLTVIFIPKRQITWREIYITFGVVGFATWVSHAFITRTLNLLDLGNPNKTGLGEILCYTFTPFEHCIRCINCTCDLYSFVPMGAKK